MEVYGRDLNTIIKNKPCAYWIVNNLLDTAICGLGCKRPRKAKDMNCYIST